MSGDDVIAALDNLSVAEREKVLAHVMQKYFKNAFEGSFIVGSTYDWWLNEKDDIYDRLSGDSNNDRPRLPKW